MTDLITICLNTQDINTMYYKCIRYNMSKVVQKSTRVLYLHVIYTCICHMCYNSLNKWQISVSSHVIISAHKQCWTCNYNINCRISHMLEIVLQMSKSCIYTCVTSSSMKCQWACFYHKSQKLITQATESMYNSVTCYKYSTLVSYSLYLTHFRSHKWYKDRLL